MKKPLLQFSLVTLWAGAVMASILIAANLEERESFFFDRVDGQFYKTNQTFVYGWPCHAANRSWYLWHSDDPRETWQWQPTVCHWPELIFNIVICLGVLLAGMYTVEWFVRRYGTAAFSVNGNMIIFVLIILLLTASLNYQRPLYSWSSDGAVGTGWGWPGAFHQTSGDSKIVLFYINALLANLLFSVAILGRMFAWLVTLMENTTPISVTSPSSPSPAPDRTLSTPSHLR